MLFLSPFLLCTNIRFLVVVSTEQMFSLTMDPSPGWVYVSYNPAASLMHACLDIALTPMLFCCGLDSSVQF